MHSRRLVILPCLMLILWLALSSRDAPPPLFPQRAAVCSAHSRDHTPAQSQAHSPCPPPPSLDYLEIGTSDFGTIVQAVDEKPYMAQLKGVLRGASVDALSTWI